MPVPFAQLDSESSGLTNLQLHFWRNTFEHFQAMTECVDDYDSGEADFFVDASMVVVLAGTSVSQLLGQQWRDGNLKVGTDGHDRVPPMDVLLNRLVKNADADRRDRLFPANTFQTLQSSFDEFMATYDAIRHFGEPKQETVAALDRAALCHYLTTVQQVWHTVAALRPTSSRLGSNFSRIFAFPDRALAE